eukprot:jgi/Tetstr1/442915/TSEL_030978.t1
MLITEQLKLADEYQKVYADRKTSPVEFAEGDKVWLSTEHLLILNQPARKFRQRYIGPYPVTAKISSQAYRLRLPPTFDCHNVFHISRLRQCVNPDAQPDTIPSSVDPPVDEFVVERVLDFSIERREDMFKRGLCLVFLSNRFTDRVAISATNSSQPKKCVDLSTDGGSKEGDVMGVGEDPVGEDGMDIDAPAWPPAGVEAADEGVIYGKAIPVVEAMAAAQEHPHVDADGEARLVTVPEGDDLFAQQINRMKAHRLYREPNPNKKMLKQVPDADPPPYTTEELESEEELPRNLLAEREDAKYTTMVARAQHFYLATPPPPPGADSDDSRASARPIRAALYGPGIRKVAVLMAPADMSSAKAADLGVDAGELLVAGIHARSHDVRAKCKCYTPVCPT